MVVCDGWVGWRCTQAALAIVKSSCVKVNTTFDTKSFVLLALKVLVSSGYSPTHNCERKEEGRVRGIWG